MGLANQVWQGHFAVQLIENGPRKEDRIVPE